MKKMLKSKEGISPILATLLLIVIAVAAVIVTYAWVMTYTTTQTQRAGTRIKIDSALINATDGNVTIYVRNNGEEVAVIDKVYIDGKDFTMYTNLTSYTLLKDKTVTILTTLSPSAEFDFSAGTTYKIKVVTTVGDIYDEISVTAS